jgi:branched-chain amino acid transport system substrate-binding protein
VNKLARAFGGLAIAAMMAAPAAAADLTVGFITSMTGPVSSIGIPYAKGIATGQAYKADVNGRKIRVIQLDDGSDPSTAARNARKLIEEEKVDVIIGSGGAPSTLAIAAVGYESKVPLIAIANANLPGEPGTWMITVPQPAPLMVGAVVERMKSTGVKTIGFIGFNDAWGDLVYDAVKQLAEPAGMKIVANERYARADTSVTAQALKVVAARPDVVITGGSGTPGALPHIALAERGYKGTVYGTHALINPDFIRVGGSSVDGMIAPTGPVVVASQLPESNPIRKVALDFEAAYKIANKEPATGGFSAYAFDAWLILADAATRTMAAGIEPGSPEFRKALRDAITTTKELVGTHAVYNFKPDDRYGTDERSRVLVQLVKGEWKLLP